MSRTPSEIEPATCAALNRTMLLMRDNLRPEVRDDQLVRALCSVSVIIEADEYTLANASAQHCFVTSALLAIRSGAAVFLLAPNVRLYGNHAPLVGSRLIDALLDTNGTIVPGLGFRTGPPTSPADFAFVLGATPARSTAHRIIRVNAGEWHGEISSGEAARAWRGEHCPFGGLMAAGLAAVELYKLAMRRLRQFATSPHIFDEFFAEAGDLRVSLEDNEPMPLPNDFGEIDFISGGAITQAVLYTLCRIPSAKGQFRVIEPEIAEESNLNRYALLRTSGLGIAKTEQLKSIDLGEIVLTPSRLRFDESTLSTVAPLKGTIVVGVDDIPTRWLVQKYARDSWIGIGATSHYLAMASAHAPGLPCAQCLHPHDEAGPAIIPTVAWVSHFAGVYVAWLLVRRMRGLEVDPAAQVVFASMLVAGAPRSVSKECVPARPNCPNGCRNSLAY